MNAATRSETSKTFVFTSPTASNGRTIANCSDHGAIRVEGSTLDVGQ
jgi:hypothetical protein